jgi:hypothetical protein
MLSSYLECKGTWERELHIFLSHYSEQVSHFFVDDIFGFTHSYDVLQKADDLANQIEKVIILY